MSFTTGVGRSARAFSKFCGWSSGRAHTLLFRGSPFWLRGVGSGIPFVSASTKSSRSFDRSGFRYRFPYGPPWFPSRACGVGMVATWFSSSPRVSPEATRTELAPFAALALGVPRDTDEE